MRSVRKPGDDARQIDAFDKALANLRQYGFKTK